MRLRLLQALGQLDPVVLHALYILLNHIVVMDVDDPDTETVNQYIEWIERVHPSWKPVPVKKATYLGERHAD